MARRVGTSRFSVWDLNEALDGLQEALGAAEAGL
jgi:hypothetical protein